MAAPRRGRGGVPAAPPGSARSGGRCCPVARRSWRPAGTAGRCVRRCSRTRSAGGATSPVRWPRCSCPRSARSRVRRRCGSCPRRPGRPQRAPAAVTTCSGCAGTWPAPTPGCGSRRRCGSVGGRATRSGWTPRRASRTWPGGSASTPGHLPPARATVILVDDVVTTGATLRACRAALVGADRDVTAAVVLADATTPDNIKKYPIGCRKNYALSHLPRSGSLEPQICCRTVISDTVGGAPSGTRTGLSGGTTDGCSEVELPSCPSSDARPVRERGVRVEIVVTGRNVEVPDHFRVHVAEKVERLERYDHKIVGLEVELFHERNRRQLKNCQRVEITGRGCGPVARAEACAQDFYSALDAAIAKLEARLRRSHDRRRITARRSTVLVGRGGGGQTTAARRAGGRRGRPTGSPRRAGGRARPLHARPRQRLGRRPPRPSTPRTTSRTTRISTTSTGRAGSSAARCTPRTR